jgi:hypothetical protein
MDHRIRYEIDLRQLLACAGQVQAASGAAGALAGLYREEQASATGRDNSIVLLAEALKASPGEVGILLLAAARELLAVWLLL